MIRSATRRRSLVAAAAVLITAALGASGCASSVPVQKGGASSSTVDVSAANAAVEAAYEGNFGEPPTTGPAPAADKDIWILSAFQQIHGIAYMSEQAQAAADALGWESSVCDGQNNANGGWSSCVRQAVSAGADAIVLESIDCGAVKAPLGEARAAGVAVVSLTSFDCDDETQGASDPQFDVTIDYLDEVTDPQTFYREQGRLRADWIISQTGGKAKVLQVLFDGVAFGTYLAQGFEEQLAACASCEIVGTVAITPADIPNIRQKFETALLQANSANAVSVDVDFMFSAGIQPALAGSGRADLVVAGGECDLTNLGYIRSGVGQQMCVGYPLGYLAYAAMDGLNRHFNGEDPVVEGIGWQLVDAEHNLPPEGEDFTGPVDYVAAYESIWK